MLMIRTRMIWATVVGGLVAGLLDHMAAIASLVPQGISPLHINQYLASAVIGPKTAFAGGWVTAALGVVVQDSAPLTGFLAGRAALRLGAIPLPRTRTRMGVIQLLATRHRRRLFFFSGPGVLLARIMPRIPDPPI
jgi:hypothetical protein